MENWIDLAIKAHWWLLSFGCQIHQKYQNHGCQMLLYCLLEFT